MIHDHFFFVLDGPELAIIPRAELNRLRLDNVDTADTIWANKV